MLPGAPSAALSSREAHKDRRTREQGNKGTREAQHHRPAPPTDKDGSQSGTQRKKEPEQVRNERKRGNEKPSKPTKKGTPPPAAAGKTLLPSTIFRAKKSAKSRLGCFEKIFGKIFRGNVSGVKKNPSRCLNGRGRS